MTIALMAGDRQSEKWLFLAIHFARITANIQSSRPVRAS